MVLGNIIKASALAAAVALAPQAQAVTVTFVGRITSGVDNGAVFSSLGASLVGRPITVTLSDTPVDSGTTTVNDYVGASVTILGKTFDASDNDIPTSLNIVQGPPDSVYGRATQNFDLGYSDTYGHVDSPGGYVPADADLNSAFSYQVKPGDTATGYFDLVNSAYPDLNYTGPPVGGPGSTTPWGDYILFSVSGVYVNSPAPIPEPAAWAMMLLGLSAVGMGLRRRFPRRIGAA